MKKIELPKTSERIRGVTLPKDGRLYVCDYDEVFKIIVGSDGSEHEVEVLDNDPYKFLDSLPHSLGVYEHSPILESNGNSITYNFNPADDFVTINYNISGEAGVLEFRTFSGDWFAASFSPCGRYLMLAEPYAFDLYEIA